MFRVFSLLAALLVVVGVGGGCAQKPPPALEAPAARVTLGHFSGTPLSGPTSQPGGAIAPAQALQVAVELWAMRQMPAEGLSSPGMQLKLIASTRGGIRVLPSARLTSGLRWATESAAESVAAATRADQTGNVVSMLAQTAALPPGATMIVDVPDDSAGSSRRVQVAIHYPRTAGAAPAVEAAITVDGPSMEDAAGAGQATDRELLALAPLAVGDGRTLVLAMPYRFSKSPAQALCAVIHVAGGTDDPAHAEALRVCLENLKRSADEAGAAAKGFAPGAARWTGLEAAIAALSDASVRRASLVYLCGQGEAAICQDVALVADDAAMDQLCAMVIKAAADPVVPRTAESLGWVLDRLSLQMLSQQLAAGKLPADLSAVLVQHTGQVGRSSAALEEVLKSAASRADLQTRLMAENFIQLEDSSPAARVAARVRACDWLVSRGAAPAGFDPLGPPRERREALEKALSGVSKVTPAGAAK
ncbi:MAG: hypothetical protein K8S98_01690 [Planctomycetes bacterium]|nr:hypothetical protein [Planctomycetota bacterium]